MRETRRDSSPRARPKNPAMTAHRAAGGHAAAGGHRAAGGHGAAGAHRAAGASAAAVVELVAGAGRFLAFAALASTLVWGVSGCDQGAPAELTEEGVSLELAELRERTIQDLQYTVDLEIPEERSEAIRGRVAVHFIWDDAEDHPLILDFQRPEERVGRVRVNGEATRYEAVHNHLVIPASALRPEDGNVVEVEFVAGDGPLNRNDEYLYTLFVPDRAHHALPLFDQPNLKGRFTLSLEVPAHWEAVANGRAANDVGDATPLTVDRAPRRTLRFHESEPIPTYLFAFAAGDFMTRTAVRAGRRMTMYYRETDEEKVARNVDTIFGLHATAVEWLEGYTGIPFPFQKLDFVAVPSFQYGGMEHPGAVLYRESSLFLDESATQAQHLGRASVIAHETAHMWFGDLVTMNWFDDVWTKEVFANFMAAKIVHPSFPELNHDLRFVLAHHPSAYGVDRTAGANPIRQPLENLREAGSLYGAIIYQKAPVVMRQLELLVGEEVFRDGMREYLSTFSYGNASWPDLVEILDRRTPDDLAAWSDVWVEEAGRPTVSTTLSLDGEGQIERLTVHQEDPSDAGRRWPQALSVLLGYDDSVRTFPVALMEESEEVAEAVGLPSPDYVLPDGAGTGYGLFRLDADSRRHLVSRLPALGDPLVRGIGYLTLYDAVLEGEVEPERFLGLLLRGAETETDEQNLTRILNYLGSVYWRLLHEEVRFARAPALEEVLWRELQEAPTSTLKASWFDAYRRIALTDEALQRLERIWSREEEVPGLPLSESDEIDLALHLAVAEVPGWEEVLEVQAERIENPERAARFQFVRPSVDADRRVREAFFESLRDPASRSREPWVLDAVAYLNHPRRAAHAERFILPALELVEEIQRTGDIFFPGRWLDATLGGHSSTAAASTVRRFLEARPDYPPRLRGKILQSADGVERAARILRATSTRSDLASLPDA